MRRNLSLACLLLAWLCANGAVWNAVQVVGWAKMFRDYSQIMPATQALRLTFNGTAPCKFCEIAEAGEEATRDATPPAVPGSGAEKIVLIADCVPAPVLVAPDFSWPGVADATGLTRTESVPVPPPRA